MNIIYFIKTIATFSYKALGKKAANNFNELELMNNVTHLDFCIRRA